MTVQLPSKAAVHGVLKESGTRSENPKAILTMLGKPLISGVDRWGLWLAIALARHEQRQEWLGRVLEKHLDADLSQIGNYGSQGYPTGKPTRGIVKGLPEWEYAFHGIGCGFTNRVDGTRLAVEFFSGRCDAIDPPLLTRYLSSLRQPELPERMLQRPAALKDAWQVDLASLSEAEWASVSVHVRISDEGRAAAEALGPLIKKLGELYEKEDGESKARAAYLAAALGDVPLVWHLANQVGSYWKQPQDLLGKLQTAMNQVIPRRFNWLLERLGSANKPLQRRALLQALADLGRTASQQTVLEHLQREPDDALLGQALEIVALWDDSALDQTVLELVERVRENPAAGQVRQLGCKLLLRHRTPDAIGAPLRKKLIDALGTDGLTGADASRQEGEAGLLLYLLDPASGLARLSESLRSDLPPTRQEAAVALAVIGTPAARDALLSVLDSADAVKTLEARTALAEFNDRTAWQTLAEWESRQFQAETSGVKSVTPDARASGTSGGSAAGSYDPAETPDRVRGQIDRLRTDMAPLMETWGNV